MFFTRVVRPVMLVVLLSGSGQSVYNQNPVPFSKLATCQEFTLNAERCMHFFPIESVKNYKTKENKIHLKFYVMAARDANIVLSSGYGENDARYTAGGYFHFRLWRLNCKATEISDPRQLKLHIISVEHMNFNVHTLLIVHNITPSPNVFNKNQVLKKHLILAIF